MLWSLVGVKGLTAYYRMFIFFALCSPVNLLTTQIPSIVRALHKQLKEKSVKTRQVHIFTV